jgi:hypothetical protein
VAARLQCNLSARSTTATAETTTRISPKQALQLAERTFLTPAKTPAVATVNTTRGPSRVAGFISDRPVHVVTSNSPVRSLAANTDTTYTGYVAVFDAASPHLLYACLGATCTAQR